MALQSGLLLKTESVLRSLRQRARLVVALSGGVDSAVLLYLALRALGRDDVLAVTGRSESLAENDLEDAMAIARHLGSAHEIVATRELEREGYRANAGDRCFHCRTELFEILLEIARTKGYEAIAYGAIVDDLGDHRPGMRAAAGLGILAPLVDAGMSKDDVREVARDAGLPVKEKPANACLSSRIPVGTAVTPERLAQVEKAEAALRDLGLTQFRVRHHGEIARIELDPEGERLLGDPSVRRRVVTGVRSAGFRFVALDLEGFRSGSLNSEPAGPPLYRIRPTRDGGQ